MLEVRKSFSFFLSLPENECLTKKKREKESPSNSGPQQPKGNGISARTGWQLKFLKLISIEKAAIMP
ncbi:hypothetical protein [Dyadobacter fermentans]|uniref:hypothetical protein n=1 Tax=Dyadobacter fermentans TaxID=94254 RepID=UPI0005A06EAF|nr:hypothetical protein [Dyadobacter fermentans]